MWGVKMVQCNLKLHLVITMLGERRERGEEERQGRRGEGRGGREVDEKGG